MESSSVQFNLIHFYVYFFGGGVLSFFFHVESPVLVLRVEFLLKTDGGYPRDAGVFFIHDGKPWEFPPLSHPLVSSTSLRPRPFRGTGRAASGGALAPELPRAICSRPEPIRTVEVLFFLVVLQLLFQKFPKVFKTTKFIIPQIFPGLACSDEDGRCPSHQSHVTRT